MIKTIQIVDRIVEVIVDIFLYNVQSTPGYRRVILLHEEKRNKIQPRAAHTLMDCYIFFLWVLFPNMV